MDLPQLLEFVDLFDPNDHHHGVSIGCEAYGQFYILSWLGSEKGWFKYGFQPQNCLCHYALGIGVSLPEKDGLRNYLQSCLNLGYKLFYACNLKDLLDQNGRILIHDGRIIWIDGKKVYISEESFQALKQSLLEEKNEKKA